MNNVISYWYLIPFFLAVLGILDAGYLTWEHFNNVIPPCSIHVFFSDCGRVLTSQYSVVFGVPLALIGLIHYTLEAVVAAVVILTQQKLAKRLLVLLVTGGFLASLYFVYIMLGVIGSICLYCMGSAIISGLLFLTVHTLFPNERVYWVVLIGGWIYRQIVKRILFLFEPEKIHVRMVSVGEVLGSYRISRWLAAFFLRVHDKSLTQRIAGIQFTNPVGLAAGFDYEAQLSQILSSVSFGFQSVGTITNNAYEGNSRPMLGRLPKSRSLMVNKGFKNLGASETIRRLYEKIFFIPLGVSIGRTNGRDMTQKASVQDIVQTFKQFEASSLTHSYYELNISCPNLYGNVSFYSPKQLNDLLQALNTLKLTKPVFVKMPIDKSDTEIVAMLKVLAKYAWVNGVIFGNLQKDRKDPALVPDEVAKFSVGNFSGKPTFRRSNELISLAYKYYAKRFTIIGCGGIFNAFDAYEKIKRGASLVQLITGMIYQGPQVIADINLGLAELLRKDGYTSITEAVGVNTKKVSA